MPRSGHLALTRFSLSAGEERRLKGSGWGLLRVAAGDCYWRERDRACGLGCGQVLVFCAACGGALLASRLGPVRGHLYFVDPRLLSGMLSMAECQILKSASVEARMNSRCFPHEHEIARKYAALCTSEEDQGPAIRVRLLELFVQAFADEFRGASCPSVAPADARERLILLVSGLPEADLVNLSLHNLARELGCSERHASRLFMSCFGVSLRAKQTQLRLAHAQQLLASSGAKVIEVAMESGFNSLSLFNSMFKRQFGMSPSAWRGRAGCGDQAAAQSKPPPPEDRAGEFSARSNSPTGQRWLTHPAGCDPAVCLPRPTALSGSANGARADGPGA